MQGLYVTNFEDRLRATIRNNRRSNIAGRTARWAERYLNAWYNTGFFDFDNNGEAFVLHTLASVCGDHDLQVWDVGAHGGDYAQAVHQKLPKAQVTSFEILPPIADRLRARNFDPGWFALEVMGLSDTIGDIEVSWNHQFDTTSAITPRQESVWFSHGAVERVSCQVTTIDHLIAEGRPPPDFLKIDVEGHEAAVLDGARDLIGSPRAPILIQFEYGDTWIPASRTLHSAQTKLEKAGYAVGRLYPDHVEFKAYAFSDERFRMGNMIAVKHPALQRALS